MASKSGKFLKRFKESETGTIRKGWGGRIRIALVYPNTYSVGMSNLGFQTVYRLFNDIEKVVCERAFLSGESNFLHHKIRSVESGRSLANFDVLAFSVSFEDDYINILKVLTSAGIPPMSHKRGNSFPLVIAGGVACFLNPEPIASFIDCFLIGEAESLISRFIDCLDKPGFIFGSGRRSCLKTIALNVPGAYVPEFYTPFYNRDGTLSSFESLYDLPDTIQRVYLKDLSHVSTCTTILTPDTPFSNTFLIETGRGCTHGCRFCSAGFIYRPPRYRSLTLIEECIEKGSFLTGKIGLVGAAVSDIPGIGRICEGLNNKDLRISFSSFRADSITPELIHVLKKSKVKTATIAPEAGSGRMRNVINKGITRDDILDAAENLVSGGIPNLKLYFMIGLPTETFDDVEAIVELCHKIKERFLKSSRVKKHIGRITVSLNSFVPKPFTPFQWAAMDNFTTLRKKIKIIKDGLKRLANVQVNAENPRRTYIQALLSRGDRKVSRLLAATLEAGGNWAKILKLSDPDSAFYVLRERSADELFPWDFIDHGLKKSFLRHEFNMAKQYKTSPPCKMDSCNICGVCRSNRPKSIQ